VLKSVTMEGEGRGVKKYPKLHDVSYGWPLITLQPVFVPIFELQSRSCYITMNEAIYNKLYGLWKINPLKGKTNVTKVWRFWLLYSPIDLLSWLPLFSLYLCVYSTFNLWLRNFQQISAFLLLNATHILNG
jgi:hypothetical protein